jgi:Kdo2-lipid IVA lauroyltransferase/acyltransferase
VSALRRIGFRLKEAAGEVVNIAAALGAALAVGLVRLLPERRAADLAGRLTTAVGMRLPRTRKVGLKNIRLAFPDKSAAEHDAILRQSWDNLGRVAVEYCHIDRIWDFDVARMAGERIEVSGIDTYIRLRDDGLPAIIVAAHLANWELPMLAAAAHGLDATALYRAPNNRWIAKWVLGQRKVAMGELIASRKGSVHHLSRVLGEGRHLGLITDQYFYDGLRLPFFGHPTQTNTLFARLARIHDCPVHAVRVVRLPGDRFRLELTEALDLPRDADGKIDIAGAAGVMNRQFEDWIREHPGQWLWFHRKWRD